MIQFLLSAVFSVSAWASGELPYPFNGQSSPTVVANHQWSVENSNLSVQIKVYADKDAKLWAKVWVRQNDGFVWTRAWIEQTATFNGADIHVDGQDGKITFMWSRPELTRIELDGRPLRLVPRN